MGRDGSNAAVLSANSLKTLRERLHSKHQPDSWRSPRSQTPLKDVGHLKIQSQKHNKTTHMKLRIQTLLPTLTLLTGLTGLTATEAVNNIAALKRDTTFAYVPGIGLLLGNADSYDTFFKNGPETPFARSPNRVIRFKEGPLFALRLQDDYKATPDDAKPAQFQWSRTDGVEAWDVRSALLLDAYFAGEGPFTHHPESLAIKFTVGADWQKVSGNKVADFQSYFAFLELRPLTSDYKNGAILKAGAVYEYDAIVGHSGWTPTLRVDPVLFDLLGVRKSFHPSTLKARLENPDELNGMQSQSLSESKQLHQKLLDGDGGDSYFIRPHMDLKTTAGEDLKKIEDISDANFVYGVDAGLNLFSNRMTITYSYNGLEPITSGGHQHTYQEVQLRYTPAFSHEHWGDVSIFATYTNGEAPPTYKKVDQVLVGIGVKL